MSEIVKRLNVLNPAQSRKALVALATLIAALGAKYGLDLDAEAIYIVLSLAVTLILSIAHEDSGAKAARRPSTLVDTEKTLGVKPESFNGNSQSNHGG